MEMCHFGMHLNILTFSSKNLNNALTLNFSLSFNKRQHTMRFLIGHLTKSTGDRKELRDNWTVIGSSQSEKSRKKERKAGQVTWYLLDRNVTVPLNAVRIDWKVLCWWSHTGQVLVSLATRLTTSVYVAYSCVWPLIGRCNGLSCSDSGCIQGQRFTALSAQMLTQSQVTTINDRNNVSTQPQSGREHKTTNKDKGWESQGRDINGLFSQSFYLQKKRYRTKRKWVRHVCCETKEHMTNPTVILLLENHLL